MSLAYEISALNRRRKWRLFLKVIAPTSSMRVLDVGFSEEEFSATDNFLEKHYPHPEKVTALGIDAASRFRERYPEVTVVRYAGGAFPFADQSFDVAWSNAVIEHVGDRSRQLLFLREVRRVARRAFLTTPNRLFPVEVHTRIPLLHYLPKRLFDRCLRLLGKEWATGDYMNLLSHSSLRELLADAGIDEFQIVRNRLGGFTLDFVVIF